MKNMKLIIIHSKYIELLSMFYLQTSQTCCCASWSAVRWTWWQQAVQWLVFSVQLHSASMSETYRSTKVGISLFHCWYNASLKYWCSLFCRFEYWVIKKESPYIKELYVMK